jgi:type VI secretion system secreted protein VgrG
MPTYTQDKRLLAVSSSLGKDVLLLRAFSGREEMSRLFRYQLELLSENYAITAPEIVGQGITFSVNHFDTPQRFFHGIVSRFTAGGRHFRGFRTYRAEVVPWLWFLTRTANCRIFQKMSVPDIIQTIFGDLGFSDFELSLQKSYVKWEYCVQYRETAFNFVSRLMEHEGIFYYFRHQEGKHTLVLADQKSGYSDCVENLVKYSSGSLAHNHISGWEHQYEFRSGQWAQTDYNFETPSTSLLTNENTLVPLPGLSKYELFDYPGEYESKGDGSVDTRVRMEEDETPYDVITGASQCCTFTPGGKFTLEQHDCPAENGDYVALVVQHSAIDRSYLKEAVGSEYRNTFTCLPDSAPFRPARLTPKPVVQGTQPALVVGPGGEEIYTDKYGRIKVQFYWDRLGKKDENSSCWIRVTQPWAGKRWGASFWPRIGQEVIVGFVEGDPDRPIVVGAVYNAEQMPPYQGGGLDGKHANDNKVSGIKTSSTKGGSGYNELRFDDTAGKEQIFVHGEKDLDVRIKNDARTSIGKDRHLTIDGKRHVKIGTVDTQEAGQEIHLKAGQKIVLEAEASLSLAVGGSVIHLTPESITITGTTVLINSNGPGPEKGTAANPDKADDSASGQKSAP